MSAGGDGNGVSDTDTNCETPATDLAGKIARLGVGTTALSHQTRPERVNDLAPPFVMNLLRKAVVASG